MARRTEAEYLFTLGHLAVLAACVIGTACVVFLLGFYVGRESAALHAPIDERVARVPAVDSDRSEGDRRLARAEVPTAAAPPASSVATRVEPKQPAVPADAVVGVIPYTVQVLATRDRGEAEAIRGRLLKRSIGAFISEVEDGATRWYRVRIGRYDDVNSARSMEARLRREMGFAQATVVPAAAEGR
jgi:cell division protein FtsN